MKVKELDSKFGEDFIEKKIILSGKEESLKLLGRQDENLRLIREQFSSRIITRGNEIKIIGPSDEVYQITLLFDELLNILRRGHIIQASEIRYALKLVQEGKDIRQLSEIFTEAICVSERGKIIRPKTMGQKEYVETIKGYDIVFGIGPAGTGKTYLAMACAVSALTNREVARIILTRPAVEAGEKLGFLPGDFQEKVDPYLRPLYDALYDIMSIEKVQELLKEGVIEIAPLAYMRGRTLNDSFVILDEAQNTTPEQMKMFLTRLGFDSKAVITGDITQIDLPSGAISGLVQVRDVLRGISGIKFCYFTDADVVRHPLVSEIIKAYNDFEAKS